MSKYKRNNPQSNSNHQEIKWKGIWIPSQLYLAKNLNWTEKILLIEIDSLNGEKGCFASNRYFANFLGVSETTISTSISKLKKMKLIKQESFDGRIRVLKADFKKTYRLPLRKLKGGFKENLKALSINNIDNNKEEYIYPQKSKKQSKDFHLYKNLSHWFLKTRASMTGGKDMHSVWDKKKKHPKDSVIERSVETIDELVRIDGYNFQTEITPVVRWVLTDDFWITNLRSLAKLRKKSKNNGGTKFENIIASYLQFQRRGRERASPKFQKQRKKLNGTIQRIPDEEFYYS